LSAKSLRSETPVRFVLCLTPLAALVTVFFVIRLVACSGISRTGLARVPGTGGVSIVSVTPSIIGFGNETVGATSASQSVTVSNQGQLGLSVSQVSIVPSEFKLSGPTPPITIPPGSRVTYNVAFAPDAAQAFSGSLTVTSNALNGIGKASLSGAGVLQTTVLNVLPAAISFGSELISTTSSAQNVLLTNGGITAIATSSVQTSAPFAVAGFNGSTTLNPAQSLMLSVTFTPTAQTSYTGSLIITSSAPSSPDAVALSGAGGLLCGQPDNGLIHIPPSYSSFMPPAKGQSYVDPTFGCTVTRITDSSKDDWSGSFYLPIGMGYATVSPFNANDTYLMLSDGWGRHFMVDLSGNTVVPIANMPGGNNGWVLWDRTTSNVFWYTNGNSLMQGTITGLPSCASTNNCTVTTTTVHTFTEYSQGVILMDETDISPDDHVVVAGQNANNTIDVFSYSVTTLAKGPAYTTTCTMSGSITGNPQPGCLHKLIQTPDDNVIIQFNSDGTCAECANRLWTGVTPLPIIQTGTNHLDTGQDLAGNNVYIEMGTSGSYPGLTNPCPSGWGLNWALITSPLTVGCLVDINAAPYHVGYRGNPNQPWVGISFFDQRNPGPEWFDNSPNFQAPTTSNWYHFESEIILVRIDANNNPSKIYRLAHARSRSAEDFNAEPKAAISRTGRYIAFSSDMAFAHTGCPANFQTTTNCTDVYVIHVQ
jgi:ASPM-SPD-2-Hydin domain-containing protein